MKLAVLRSTESEDSPGQGIAKPGPSSGTPASEMAERGDVKKAVPLVLEEAEWIELHRLLIDDDAEAALAWLRRHFAGKTLRLL